MNGLSILLPAVGWIASVAVLLGTAAAAAAVEPVAGIERTSRGQPEAAVLALAQALPGLRGAARVEALVVQGSAKGQGRNRAIGITAARADEDAALRQIEADFDQAWQDGRITLQRTAGPAAPDAELAPAPAEEATESRKAPALVA